MVPNIIGSQIWMEVVESVVHDGHSDALASVSLLPGLHHIQIQTGLAPCLSGVQQVPLLVEDRVVHMQVQVSLRVELGAGRVAPLAATHSLRSLLFRPSSLPSKLAVILQHINQWLFTKKVTLSRTCVR